MARRQSRKLVKEQKREAKRKYDAQITRKKRGKIKNKM